MSGGYSGVIRLEGESVLPGQEIKEGDWIAVVQERGCRSAYLVEGPIGLLELWRLYHEEHGIEQPELVVAEVLPAEKWQRYLPGSLAMKQDALFGKALQGWGAYYQGWDPDVEHPAGKGAHIFAFVDDPAGMDSFLNEIGGTPHPQGGGRVLLASGFPDQEKAG
jgi:hypothetical protein